MKDSIFQSTPCDHDDFFDMNSIPIRIVLDPFDDLTFDDSTHCKSS